MISCINLLTSESTKEISKSLNKYLYIGDTSHKNDFLTFGLPTIYVQLPIYVTYVGIMYDCIKEAKLLVR